MYDLEFALVNLRVYYRFYKRGMREFINDELLDSVLKKLEKALYDNSKSFNMGEDIIIVERVGDSFKARKISPSDSSYLSMYTLQRTKINKWMDACKMIKDYIRDYDKNLDSLMDEVYENVSASYDEKKSKFEDSVSDVDNIINSLTQKAAEFKKVIEADKSRVSKIAIRKVKRLYNTICEVNDYYNKLENLSNNDDNADVLGFYEENSEYIEEDLVLDIDYLHKKLDEYKKLHVEKKPLVLVKGEDDVVVLSYGQDDEYDTAFIHVIDDIEKAIGKAEFIKDKNYVHDDDIEPVRDSVMEMIFDEFYDASQQINDAIKDGDNSEFSDMLVWTEASDKILNSLKEELENDYKNGNKIKVAKFENEEYIVTEEENTLENYEMQLEFLNNCINWCKDTSYTINKKLDEKNSAHSRDFEIEKVLNNNFCYDFSVTESAIRNGEYVVATWVLPLTNFLINYFNGLKEKLENDYQNGNKIKVCKLVNGKYVVTEEENTLENYEAQLKFLDESISKCDSLVKTINDVGVDFALEGNINSLLRKISWFDNYLEDYSFNTAGIYDILKDFDNIFDYLEKLKQKLEKDYRNGNKIKVCKLEDDKCVVTEEENTLENYEAQLKFLNDIISKFESIRPQVMSKLSATSPSTTGESFDTDAKYVVAQHDDVVYIVSSSGYDDMESIDSDLLREAKDSGLDIDLHYNLSTGLHVINGLLVEVSEDGTITIGSHCEKIEFHNQEELIKSYDDTKDKTDTLGQLIEFRNNNNILGIKKVFKDEGPRAIWSMLAGALTQGSLDISECSNFVDFIVEKYGVDDIWKDEVIYNDEYRSLLNLLNAERVQPLEPDVTKVLKPLDVREGKKVVRREKKKSLIEKFKGLKRWQKTVIVAGLSLAGVAIIGVGVYHLIPEVKPMIDGFIQNLHFPNLGQPVSEAIAQSSVAPTEGLTQVPQAASVDYSSFGEGHRVFADAYSAASGVNPMEATLDFINNPLDVFNVDTNEFMHLSSEQLHDAGFLKTLASDPNNTMLFGADMANPDGFVPLSEIVGEAIKGGKIL